MVNIALWKLLNFQQCLKFENNVELKDTLINRPGIKHIQFSSQCWERAWNKAFLLETPFLPAASLKFLDHGTKKVYEDQLKEESQTFT